METFETHPYALSHLLQSIHEGDLALPDFQRDFVWDPRATEELIESISRNFPAGSLLLMPSTGTFKPRAIAAAPGLNGTPARLILDGQQRLTSLYQACYGVGESRYFIELGLLADGGDTDDAVFYRHHKRIGPYKSRKDQAEKLILPLGTIFGSHGGFEAWLDEVIELRPEDPDARKELKLRLRNVYESHVKPIEVYRFPAVVLDAKTPLEAVCSIFETLNRTGTKLTVFELLAARFYAQDLDLRRLWEATLTHRPIIEQFGVDPYYVLQSIALRINGQCKRADVLKLSRGALDTHWDSVTRGYAEALEMLRSECGVLTPKWLSYQYLLVPLGSVWAEGMDVPGPAAGLNRDRAKRWFWCSALSSTYEFAANSQAARDFNELRAWFNSGSAPQPVTAFAFDLGRLREITPRQQSAYKALIALILRNGALDFHKGRPITHALIAAEGVDDHHVFPTGFLSDEKIEGPADCILNRTLIDAATNRRIGKRAPSDYLSEIGATLAKESTSALADVLNSHLLPSEGVTTGSGSPLLEDDFESFLGMRSARLQTAIEQATGRSLSVRAIDDAGLAP